MIRWKTQCHYKLHDREKEATKGNLLSGKTSREIDDLTEDSVPPKVTHRRNSKKKLTRMAMLSSEAGVSSRRGD